MVSIFIYIQSRKSRKKAYRYDKLCIRFLQLRCAQGSLSLEVPTEKEIDGGEKFIVLIGFNGK